MKKKTAMVIFLCFVCVAVIGICAMAGISKACEIFHDAISVGLLYYYSCHGSFVNERSKGLA